MVDTMLRLDLTVATLAGLLAAVTLACSPSGGGDAPDAAPLADTGEEDTAAPPDTTPPTEDAVTPDVPPYEDGIHLRRPPLLEDPRYFFPGGDQQSIRVQPSFALQEAFRLVAAWTGAADDGELGIYVATYDTSVAEVTERVAPYRLNTDLRGIHNEPTVCTRFNGAGVVVWSQDTQEVGAHGENLEIRYRLIDAHGEPRDDTDRRILTDRPGNHWLGHVACHPGGFVVAGVRPGDPAPGFEVFIQRFGTSGEPVGDPVAPSVATLGQGFPAVASNDHQDIAVAFEDTATSGADAVVLGRLFGSALNAPGPLLTVAGAPGQDAQRAGVALDHMSRELLAVATVGTRVQLRRFPDGGAPFDVALPEAPTAVLTNATVAPLREGRFAVVTYRGTGANVDLRLVYLEADGTVSAETTVASGSFPLAYRPTLAYRDGALAVGWTESLGGGQFRLGGAVYREQPAR